MRAFLGFVTGLVFGLGLVVSGMPNPAKVLNFLDVFGTWDPSLAYVMGGAVLVTFIGYQLAWAREVPLLGERFDLPTRRDLDPRLLGGAALFGLGWGLGGYCPGPALTALPLAATGTLIFVPAMLAGMWMARAVAGGALVPRHRGSGRPRALQPAADDCGPSTERRSAADCTAGRGATRTAAAPDRKLSRHKAAQPNLTYT